MAPEITITFDNDSRDFVLNSIGITKNKRSLIDIDKPIVSLVDNKAIKEKEFGGVLKGSKVFIRKDTSELVQFFLRTLDK
ncbi:hypothetical protein HN903_02375 [archaeon]|jgi:hypothetical protein|nr:hypothetical protein [archaeon]MBT7128579.1 hypothetical protein [archaeon]